MMENTVTGYMCGVDFQHELAHIGGPIYASVEDLKAKRECVKQCGIVKVEIRLLEWKQPQDFCRDVPEELQS